MAEVGQKMPAKRGPLTEKLGKAFPKEFICPKATELLKTTLNIHQNTIY